MAILGNNTHGATTQSSGTGRMGVSPFTLASAATLTELHAYLVVPSASMRIVAYADSGGVPGARLAYTNPFTGGDAEYSESGFSVSLAAGTYWLGVRWASTSGQVFSDATGNSYYRISSGTSDPPPDPFGTGSVFSSANLSVWAVVTSGGGGGPTFVPQIVIT